MPIDECHDDDIDFNQMPELRNLRPISLQPNGAQKVKQPLARHISSPVRFNYSFTDSKEGNVDRSSDTSFASAGSKMSFRNFIRRMSTKGRRRPTSIDIHREKRKTMSIRSGSDLFLIWFRFDYRLVCYRSIDEAEEAINKSFEECNEVERATSKCSEEQEAEDDTSVSELMWSKSLSLHKCLSNDSWSSHMCSEKHSMNEQAVIDSSRL